MRIASATLVLVLSTVASALVNNFWRVGKDVRLNVHHRAGGEAPRVMPDAHGDARSGTSPQRHPHLTYKLPASRSRITPETKQRHAVSEIPHSSRFLLSFVPQDPFQCRECTGGSYCYQDALTRCPPHSTSQNRSDDASDCRCKAGFYQNASWADGGACLPCTAGFYCPAGRVACHAGSHSAEGSSARESCICTAGFTQAGENCTACAPGTYKAEAGSAGCSQCAGGAYADGSAAAECAACPAHTVSPPGAADAAACVAAAGAYGPPGRAAQLCAKGFYADKTNSSECEPCSSYSYLPSTGATSVQACLACPAGSAVYVSLVPLEEGAVSAPNGVGSSAADCVCRPGFEAVGGVCIGCAAGAYKAEAGGGLCAPCPADTFAVPGGVRCLACTAHSRSDAGSPSVQSCSCNAGYSLDSSEMALDASCRACEPGKFKAAVGNAACSSCAAGFYQPAEAQSACLLCAEDRFVPALQTVSCVACGAHELAPAGSSGDGACACRSGFARSALALQLLLGQWRVANVENGDLDGDGNADCLACPPGSFRNASAERAECERCPRGQVTLHSASGGAHDCVACDVGSYAANTVNGSFCRACMLHANTSEEYVGVYDPLNDADDSYHPDSPTFRSNINLCRCSAGYFRAASSGAAVMLQELAQAVGGVDAYTLEQAAALEAGLTCATCMRGKFKAAPGNEACTPCPPGTGGAAGSLRVRAEHACVACGAGTYSRLLPAPEDEVREDEARDVFQCVPCAAHAVSAVGSTALENCTCDSGFAFAGTGLACEACAAGKFKALAGNGHCWRCARGSYALGAASACAPCPENTTTAEEGAENSSMCVCSPGYARWGQAPALACALCPPGAFSTELGAATCDDCGPDKFLSPHAALGERDCVRCPENSSAVSRAHSLAGCVAHTGFRRVSTNATVRVDLEVALPYSLALFASVQDDFVLGMAAAGGAACRCAAAVRLTRVVSLARRLLQDEVLVGVELTVPELEAGVLLVHALSAAGINEALAELGVQPASRVSSGPTLLTGVSFAPCPADAYCPTQDVLVACPPNTTAPAGSEREDQCLCVAGFFGAARNCSLCPVDYFCPGSGRAAQPCPANASTLGRVGARAVEDCECDAGMYRAGDECRVCPEDSFCYGEAKIDCPPNSTAPRGATGVDDCACDSGRYRAVGPGCEDASCVTCSACPPTSVCHPGGAIEVCAANASNVNFACRCAPESYCAAPHYAFGYGASCGNASTCLLCARATYCDGIAATPCGAGADALAGSSGAASCRCEPGFYRLGALCAPCGVGFACPGGVADRISASATWIAISLHKNESRLAVALFDPRLTTLGPLTTDISLAVCREGYFRTSRVDTCKLCPRNFWCPPERQDSLLPNVIACLENEVTDDMGAYSSDECYCAAGFKTAPQDAVSKCVACKAGERCQAGEVVETQCHMMQRVPNADHSKCVCDLGHGENNLECLPCPPGSSKSFIGDAPCAFCSSNEYIEDARGACQPCPAHSFSRPGSPVCTCVPPYVMAGAECALCADDFYWATLVTPPSWLRPLGDGEPPGACLPCPGNSSSDASAAMPLGVASCKCAAGSSQTPQLPRNVSLHSDNATSANHLLQCRLCAPGLFEGGGVCRACPANATTPPGASGATACLCDAQAAANSCRSQRVDGSCAGACSDTPASCSECAPGLSKPLFSLPGNRDACAQCGVGEFQHLPGSAECEACPAEETTLLPGSTALSDCRCVPGWTRAGAGAGAHGTCAPCLPGHFKPDVGDEPCTVCGVGRFQAAGNATACRSCAAATASLAAFADAVASGVGNSTHPAHPALEANSTHGETSVSVFQCVCEVGHEPQPESLGSKRCVSCLRGSFKPGIGLEQCFYCGRSDIPGVGGSGLNSYGSESSPVVGFQHCVPCPPDSGQDAAIVGPSALMDGVDKCKCFPGFDKRTELGCSICREHMLQPQYSDADCAFCAAGHYFIARQYPCVLCDLLDEDNHDRHQGRVANSVNLSYAWGVGEQDCVCRRGYERLADSFTCTKCRPGNFHPDPFAHLCRACDANTYQPQQASLECLACPAHSTTLNGTGTSSIQSCVCSPGFESLVDETCQLCPAGKYRSERAANFEDDAPTACLQCPANAYCVEGAIDPQSCAPQEISAPGSTTVGDCQCSAGRGRPGPAESCADCPHGAFSLGETNSPCQQCPLHKNTSTTGANALVLCKCAPGFGAAAGDAATAACAPCGDGFFAPGGQDVPCVHCGFGTVTEPPSAATGPEACQCDSGLGLGLQTR